MVQQTNGMEFPFVPCFLPRLLDASPLLLPLMQNTYLALLFVVVAIVVVSSWVVVLNPIVAVVVRS